VPSMAAKVDLSGSSDIIVPEEVCRDEGVLPQLWLKDKDRKLSFFILQLVEEGYTTVTVNRKTLIVGNELYRRENYKCRIGLYEGSPQGLDEPYEVFVRRAWDKMEYERPMLEVINRLWMRPPRPSTKDLGDYYVVSADGQYRYIPARRTASSRTNKQSSEFVEVKELLAQKERAHKLLEDERDRNRRAWNLLKKIETHLYDAREFRKFVSKEMDLLAPRGSKD
jgi:hypothetical protein